MSRTNRSALSTIPARALAAAVFALSSSLASTAVAQDAVAHTNGFELRPYAGAFIPTGKQRDLLRDAVIVGGQASYRLNPQFAITGTLGWAPSKDRITAGDQKLDVWQYDLGAELRAPSWVTSGAIDFTPFVGLGAGARTYSYRDLDVDAETDFAGYGAAGVHFANGRFGLRLEARDYLSSFDGLDGKLSDSSTRNDLFLTGALSIRF